MGRTFITLDLDDDVWEYVKRRAAVHRVSPELFVSAVIEQYVYRRRAAGHAGADLWTDIAPEAADQVADEPPATGADGSADRSDDDRLIVRQDVLDAIDRVHRLTDRVLNAAEGALFLGNGHDVRLQRLDDHVDQVVRAVRRIADHVGVPGDDGNVMGTGT